MTLILQLFNILFVKQTNTQRQLCTAPDIIPICQYLGWKLCTTSVGTEKREWSMRAREMKGGSIEKVRLKIDFEEWIEFTQGEWHWFLKQGIKEVQAMLVDRWRNMSNWISGKPVVGTVGNKMR